jgi:hypothetical protein
VGEGQMSIYMVERSCQSNRSLKFTPENKVLFLSDKSIEIDIETIVDTYLLDCFIVPEFTAAVLIETDNDNSYFIALEQIDRFSDELAERITKVRNKEPRLAS